MKKDQKVVQRPVPDAYEFFWIPFSKQPKPEPEPEPESEEEETIIVKKPKKYSICERGGSRIRNGETF